MRVVSLMVLIWIWRFTRSHDLIVKFTCYDRGPGLERPSEPVPILQRKRLNIVRIFKQCQCSLMKIILCPADRTIIDENPNRRLNQLLNN